MTDVSDRATQREEELRADALDEQAHRDPTRGKTVADSATHCAICEQRIPVKRRRAVPGVQTCVECQADVEKGLL